MAVWDGSAIVAGMALGTASTLSVGPNNLMLVREGLVRGRIALVASSVCASYLVLLASALMLADTIAAYSAPLGKILSWSGVAALTFFAFLSLRASLASSNAMPGRRRSPESRATCLKRVVKTVWLNPLSYVEMVFIPSSIGRTLDGHLPRLMFTFGVAFIMALSCYGYAFGADTLARFCRRERSLRLFDLGSGVMLLILSVLLGADLMLRQS